MKFSTIILGLTVVTAVVGFMGQVALLGLVPTLLVAAGMFKVGEILEEQL